MALRGPPPFSFLFFAVTVWRCAFLFVYYPLIYCIRLLPFPIPHFHYLAFAFWHFRYRFTDCFIAATALCFTFVCVSTRSTAHSNGPAFARSRRTAFGTVDPPRPHHLLAVGHRQIEPHRHHCACPSAVSGHAGVSAAPLPPYAAPRPSAPSCAVFVRLIASESCG